MTGSTLASLAANSDIFQTSCSSYLGIQYCPSYIAQIFVPLRFAFIFYSKILSFEPTHGAPHAPNRRTISPD